MRVAVLALALAALAGPVQAQQPRTILVRFDGQATGSDANDVIARRQAARAWQDSVQAYMEAMTIAGWRLAPTSATSGSFYASVVATPISKPGYSATAIGVVLMEPAFTTSWKYVTHFVAVAESAQQAAALILEQSTESLRQSRPAR